MDRKEEKKLEAWAENIMGEAPLESPSPDFSQKLMQRIAQGQQKEVYRYRPLVAKGTFALMIIGFAVLCGYFFLSGEASREAPWIPPLDLAPFFGHLGAWSDRWASSKVTLYATSIFGLMYLVQFIFLKRRLERRTSLD